MKKNYLKTIACNLFLLTCIFGLADYSFPQKSKLKNSDEIVFEFFRGSFANAKRREISLFIYKSGRIECEFSTEISGKKSDRLQKNCLQISKTKINELIKIAEMPDFLNAEESYSIFNGGIDNSKWAGVTYYRKKGDKDIDFTSDEGVREDEENALPKAVSNFLTKIKEIEKLIEKSSKQKVCSAIIRRNFFDSNFRQSIFFLKG